MSKVAKEQIESWKKQYGAVYEIEVDGKKGYFVQPTIKVWQYAFAQMQQSDILYQQALVENCFVGGDAAVKEGDAFYATAEQLNELFDIPEAEVNREGNLYEVTIAGKSCKLHAPSRDQIVAAEKFNARRQPLKTQMALLDKIWKDGDQSLKEDSLTYLALLTSLDELREKKMAQVKKL